MQSFSQDPKDPDFVQNPYRFYDRLRAAGNVGYWTELDLPVISSHDGVSMALRDNRFGRAAPDGFAPDIPAHLAPFYDIEAHSMLENEGDKHRRLRGLVLRAFTSRRIAALQPEIEAICDDLLDQMSAGTTTDLLTSYCQPIPVRVIARLMGIPETMSSEILQWSSAMVAMYQPNRGPEIEQAAVAAAQEFSTVLRRFIEARRGDPRDDLISELIAAEEEGSKLSTDEMIATCILLLNAGHEATVHALGIAVKTLLEHCNHGALRAALAPEACEGTIEEILRYDPPLHLFRRWVYEDTQFLGHDFKRGDSFGVLLGAANRDDDAWDDPASFDPSRPVKQNAAFGGGVHFCVGAPLARMEMRIALPRLFDRFPEMTLATPPQFAPTWHFHGLARLNVRL